MSLLLCTGSCTFLCLTLLLLSQGQLPLALLFFFFFAVSLALALGRLLLLLPGFLAAALFITARLGLALRSLIFAAFDFPLTGYALIVFSNGTLA